MPSVVLLLIQDELNKELEEMESEMVEEELMEAPVVPKTTVKSNSLQLTDD